MTADTKYRKLFTESKEVNMIPVTYEELVNTMLSGKLIPGVKYRITDYLTVGFNNRESMEKPFDIVTVALDESTISELCGAVWSERDVDNYFATSNLEGWRLRYCLHPENRFALPRDWVHKGLIYEMQDENNNICPYDFKNLLSPEGHLTFSTGTTGEEVDLSIGLANARNNTIISYGSREYSKAVIPCVSIYGAETIVDNTIISDSFSLCGRFVFNNRFDCRIATLFPLENSGTTYYGGYYLRNNSISTVSSAAFTMLGSTSEIPNININDCEIACYNTGILQIPVSSKQIKISIAGSASRKYNISDIPARDGMTIRFAGDDDTYASMLYQGKLEIHEGVWDSINQTYTWTDKSITL